MIGFVLRIQINLIDGTCLNFEGSGAQEIGRANYFGGWPTVSISPKQLACSLSVDDLVQSLSENVIDDDYENKSLDELRMNELLPFQAGIDAGADAVMMGHLTLPQIDEQPALFSYAIVTDLLRVEMGFQGVVMTDALEMAAIADYYSSAITAVKAVSAGVDMLLVPVNLTDSVNALENAVNNGTITEERIDRSVARILALKIRRGILN